MIPDDMTDALNANPDDPRPVLNSEDEATAQRVSIQTGLPVEAVRESLIKLNDEVKNVSPFWSEARRYTMIDPDRLEAAKSEPWSAQTVEIAGDYLERFAQSDTIFVGRVSTERRHAFEELQARGLCVIVEAFENVLLLAKPGPLA